MMICHRQRHNFQVSKFLIFTLQFESYSRYPFLLISFRLTNLIFSNLTVLRDTFYKWRTPHTWEVICLWLQQGFRHAVPLKNEGHKASEGAAKFTSFPGFYCSIVSGDEPRFQGTRVIDQIKPYLSKIIISWKHMSRKGLKKILLKSLQHPHM